MILNIEEILKLYIFILNSSDKENTDVESSTLLDTAVFNRMGVMIAGQWMIRFEELKQYVEEYGRIPSQSTGSLGGWCNDQRQAKKGRAYINKERIKLLESISGWYWEKPDEWTPMFEELKKYVEEHNCIPPQSAGSLGIWSQKQRQAKKGQNRRIITEERIKLLESIPGWFWDVPDSQEHFISILNDYINKYNKLPDCTGSPNAPTAHNNYNIKPFMRMGYVKKSLDKEVQKEFDEIIYKYEPNSYNWKPARW